MESVDSSFEFIFRVYPKQRAIQFKPVHDKHNHFSIIWTKEKALSKEDFELIRQEITEYLQKHNNQLTFTIYRVCENCTYGRFDDDFEQLIFSFRKRFKGIYSGKDLPLDDPKHQFLKDLVKWDEENPIIHHVHGQSKTEPRWEELFWEPKAKFGDKVECKINF